MPLKWTHNGKTYWFTYYNESTGKRALQHLDEIECEDGRKGNVSQGRKINERFQGVRKYWSILCRLIVVKRKRKKDDKSR